MGLIEETYNAVGDLAGEVGRLRLLADALIYHAKRKSPIQFILGTFLFSLDTASPQGLTRSTNFNWAAQARLGRDVGRQYMGRGDDTITMNGVILPYYKGGLGQIEYMRSMAGVGSKMLLMDGNGIIYGNWCITNVNEKQSVFRRDGSPKKVEFSLTLSTAGSELNLLPF